MGVPTVDMSSVDIAGIQEYYGTGTDAFGKIVEDFLNGTIPEGIDRADLFEYLVMNDQDSLLGTILDPDNPAVADLFTDQVFQDRVQESYRINYEDESLRAELGAYLESCGLPTDLLSVVAAINAENAANAELTDEQSENLTVISLQDSAVTAAYTLMMNMSEMIDDSVEDSADVYEELYGRIEDIQDDITSIDFSQPDSAGLMAIANNEMSLAMSSVESMKALDKTRFDIQSTITEMYSNLLKSKDTINETILRNMA